MIKYLRTARTFEDSLIADGLSRFAGADGVGELSIYGGEFQPGADFDLLIKAHFDDTLLGFCGLWFPEFSVVKLDGALRAHLGAVMQLAPTGCRFVADKLSRDWSLHYGFESVVGGHPGWLAKEDGKKDQHKQNHLIEVSVWAKVDLQGGVVVAHNDVGLAIASALVGRPCVLYATHEWGDTHHIEYTPLVRFAATYGLQQNLAYTKEEVAEKRKTVRPVPAATVEAAKRAAKDTIQQLLDAHRERYMKRHDVGTILAAAGLNEGSVSVSTPMDALMTAGFTGSSNISGPRELVLGTVFDPATHYTKEYYGGEAGLLYTDAAGNKQLYHGPAHKWGAHEVIVKMMKQVLPGTGTSGPSLLDIGCGAGDFVHNARKGSFDAYGVDISSAAIAAADTEVRDFLVCGDVTVPIAEWRASTQPTQFNVVTALDFWEHIFEPELDTLIAGVKSLLAPGGIGFFVICTRANKGERDWTVARGDVFTKENSFLLCSGHVTIRRWGWWAKRFAQHGLQIRNDIAYLFQVLRDEDPGLASCMSWSSKNTLIVQR